ncbi:MAG: aminotransferase class I/II-fold pyridoxal phosphate-dependent enzyme [Deltaproteobacteria bacterium]|nr:aminotransferase class I/II-fold pyridoxal phosphate-dependent enzyme [Deltaproteobacteria bacterium]
MLPSSRIRALGTYPFAAIGAAVARLQAAGVDVVDFGVGDPSIPTPAVVREACRRGVEHHAASGYPSYVGRGDTLEAIAAWNLRRFGVRLDPGRELALSIGAKEAVFHFPEALLEPGDVVLVPNPGYPPYRTGTRFAEGVVHAYPLTPENGFLPDLEGIPPEVAARARLLWLTTPHSPTGRLYGREVLASLVAWAAARGIVVASDEAYSELWFRARPPSILEVAREGVLVFQSLSKRSCMTGYRVGWVAGDPRLVDLYRKLKTNIDSGVPDFIQDAAIAALGDEAHVDAARAVYAGSRARLRAAFAAAGLPDADPDATIYLWQPVPPGLDDETYARLLLDPRLGIVVIPGSWLAETVDGRNPGQGFVRWALTPPPGRVDEAAARLEGRWNEVRTGLTTDRG